MIVGLRVSVKEWEDYMSKRCKFKNFDEDKDIFDRDCEACPFYHLLYAPNVMYDNGFTYIDRIMFTAFDICHRRVGISLAANPLVSRIFKQLCTPSTDTRMKITMLLCLMLIEPKIIEWFKSMYRKPKNLAKFETCLPHFMNATTALMTSIGFNIYTSSHIINDYINDIVTIYQSGGVIG